jgi:hypothetical protein
LGQPTHTADEQPQDGIDRTTPQYQLANPEATDFYDRIAQRKVAASMPPPQMPAAPSLPTARTVAAPQQMRQPQVQQERPLPGFEGEAHPQMTIDQIRNAAVLAGMDSDMNAKQNVLAQLDQLGEDAYAPQ